MIRTEMIFKRPWVSRNEKEKRHRPDVVLSPHGRQ